MKNKMDKNVQIKITVRQTMAQDTDETVVCAEGTYEQKKEMHRIGYQEKTEEGAWIQNLICVSNRGVKICRRGAMEVDMFLIPGEKRSANYKTPYGPLSMETDCREIHILKEGNELTVRMEYTLSSNDAFIADCVTEISVLT